MRIEARKLRDKAELDKVPAKAGYYKWWAGEPEFRLLVERLGVDFDECSARSEKEDGLYCIYVGQSSKLKDRLGNHVTRHRLDEIESGRLSTFRQTLSSVVAGDQSDMETTDAFIDKLYVEWFLVDPTTDDVNEIETQRINEYLRILNGMKNHDEYHEAKISKKLTAIRNEAKHKALNGNS